MLFVLGQWSRGGALVGGDGKRIGRLEVRHGDDNGVIDFGERDALRVITY